MRYPTLAYPEPVTVGKDLEIRVALPKDVRLSDISLKISNTYFGSYVLKLAGTPSYSARWRAWILRFAVPKDVKPGLYNFTLKFRTIYPRANRLLLQPKQRRETPRSKLQSHKPP